jgi:hypothetical protein
MPDNTKARKSLRNSLPQSTGGPGSSSRVTDANGIEDKVLGTSPKPTSVVTGGPGHSSRVTEAATMSQFSLSNAHFNNQRLPSPPASSSPSSPRSRSISPFTSEDDSLRPYTIASSFITNQVAKIMQPMIREDKWRNNYQDSCHLGMVEKGRWETRENGDKFIITADGMTDIYVRSCYNDLYRIFDEKWRGVKKRGVGVARQCALITGTPGIGKSVFGLVLAKFIMQREKPALIFYKHFNSGQHVKMFWQGSHYLIDRTEAMKLVDCIVHCKELFSECSNDLDAIEIWSIADTQVPIEYDCINQVCIASPGKAEAAHGDNIKSWRKDNLAMKLTMPPCNWDEILNIRLALRLSFEGSLDECCPLGPLKDRFDVWGGVPRTLLSEPSTLLESEAKF